jgi:hypothetical protein
MSSLEYGTFADPDELRSYPRGHAETLVLKRGEVERLTLGPGWRWSVDVKPLVGTDSCQVPHFQYHLRGRLHIRLDDGTEYEAVAGDVTSLPAGHDAWVVGDEDVVVIDWSGAIGDAE